MLEFVNLLLVPVISIKVLYRRKNKELHPSLGLLAEYAVSVVTNVILTFAFMLALKIVVGISAAPDSQTYTVIAAVIAFLSPYVYEIYKKYINIKCEISE